MSQLKMTTEERIKNVKSHIAEHPDFPKPGILFKDIFPVLRNPDVFKQLTDVMTEHIKQNHPNVDIIVGLESRGFLFGPIIAQNLGASFVPIRKKGKLPGETVKVTYTLEYGEDCLEVQKNAVNGGQTVVIVDDLLATGGTMKAAIELVESSGGVIKEGLVVIELLALKGRDICQTPVTSLIQY